MTAMMDPFLIVLVPAAPASEEEMDLNLLNELNEACSSETVSLLVSSSV